MVTATTAGSFTADVTIDIPSYDVNSDGVSEYAPYNGSGSVSVTTNGTLSTPNNLDTVSMANWVYGSDASSPSITTIGGAAYNGGAITYSYKGRGATAYAESGVKPKYVGEYTVTATSTANGTVFPKSVTHDFEITEGTQSPNMISSTTMGTNSTLLLTTLVGGASYKLGTISFSVVADGGTGASVTNEVELNSVATPGTVTVRLTLNEYDENSDGVAEYAAYTATQNISVDISHQPNNLDSVTMPDWVYGTSSASPTVSYVGNASPNGGQLSYTYQGVNATTYPQSNTVPRYVGEYSVTATSAVNGVVPEKSVIDTFNITAVSQIPSVVTSINVPANSTFNLASLVSAVVPSNVSVQFVLNNYSTTVSGAVVNGSTLTGLNATGVVKLFANINISGQDVGGDSAHEYASYSGSAEITINVIPATSSGSGNGGGSSSTESTVIIPPVAETLPSEQTTSFSGYRITLNLMGGMIDDKDFNPIIYTDEDGYLDFPSDPIRDGFIFKGWYTKAEDGEKVDENELFTKNTTLYAMWEEESQSEEPATDDEQDEQSDDTQEEESSVESQQSASTAQEPESGFNILWIIVPLLVLGAVAGFIVYRKKKSEE